MGRETPIETPPVVPPPQTTPGPTYVPPRPNPPTPDPVPTHTQKSEFLEIVAAGDDTDKQGTVGRTETYADDRAVNSEDFATRAELDRRDVKSDIDNSIVNENQAEAERRATEAALESQRRYEEEQQRIRDSIDAAAVNANSLGTDSYDYIQQIIEHNAREAVREDESASVRDNSAGTGEREVSSSAETRGNIIESASVNETVQDRASSDAAAGNANHSTGQSAAERTGLAF